MNPPTRWVIPRIAADGTCVSALITILLCAATALPAHAQGDRFWASDGITNVNGSAGGGITTWAVLNGYASDTQTSANFNISHVGVDDFRLDTASVGLNWHNRVALTVAANRLRVEPLDTTIRQETLGLKLRLTGHAVYDRYGQFSAGLQYTHNDNFAIPRALGARSASGVDFYLAASKVFLAGLANRNVLINATVRATKANQLGLLGFGSNRDNRYHVVGEFSAGLFLSRRWLIGAEYRQKPDNLRAVGENDWKSAYLVYIPSRHLSISAAYVDLGTIAGYRHQNGYFLSLQTGL